MAQLFSLANQVEINESGLPYAGAQLLFYQTGTLTPQNVYQDATLSTPHPQPILADDTGYFPPIWLNPNAVADYRYQLLSASGGVIRDIPRVSRGAVSAQQIGEALYPITTAEQAASVTVANSTYPPGDVRRYGAAGDGATNDTAALQSAIDAACAGAGRVYLPAGIYPITATLTVPDGFGITISGAGAESVILKTGNVDVIDLGAMSTLKNLLIDGDGDNYTGRGVVITTGGLDEVSWRRLSRVSIIRMAAHCVEFTQARAGYASMMELCRFTLAGANKWTTHCVKFPDTESHNGNRYMMGCWSFGYRLFDAAGCDNLLVTGCQGGVFRLTADSKKVVVTGCRIVGSADIGNAITIDGIDARIVGNVFAPMAITFAATCGQVQFENAAASGSTFVDLAAGAADGNNLSIPTQFYAPAWAATSGTAPAIGDGVLSGTWSRRGAFAHVNIRFTPGASTTFGSSGFWTFKLPYKAHRLSVGQAFMLDDVAPGYVGVAVVDGGSDLMRIMPHNSSAYVGVNAPFTWVAGDKMAIDIEYQIE
jgi:hypothetical protein